MRDFKKRRTRGSEILRVSLGFLGIMALATVAFMASRAAWGMYGKFAAASAARFEAETKLKELEAREAKIRAEVSALSSERGIEAAVRERYGVAKPGEGQIAIVRQSTSSEAIPVKAGFLEKLWKSLFVW